MHLLVTGATGFIGRRLIRRLTSESFVARCTLLTRAPSQQFTGLDDRFVWLTLPEPWSLGRLREVVSREAPEVVVNLATAGVGPIDRDPERLFEVNAALPGRLARLAAESGAAFISIGTQSEYAPAETGIATEESAALNDNQLYGASKAAGWLNASAITQTLNGRALHLRLFNVYGPGEAAHRLLPTLIAAKASGGRAGLSDGSQVRDFVHVDDVAEAIVLGALRLRRGTAPICKPINISTGKGHEVRSFVRVAAELLDLADEQLGFGDVDRRVDDIDVVIGNCERASRCIGWRARLSVQDGLAATLAEAIHQGNNP